MKIETPLALAKEEVIRAARLVEEIKRWERKLKGAPPRSSGKMNLQTGKPKRRDYDREAIVKRIERKKVMRAQCLRNARHLVEVHDSNGKPLVIPED